MQQGNTIIDTAPRKMGFQRDTTPPLLRQHDGPPNELTRTAWITVFDYCVHIL